MADVERPADAPTPRELEILRGIATAAKRVVTCKAAVTYASHQGHTRAALSLLPDLTAADTALACAVDRLVAYEDASPSEPAAAPAVQAPRPGERT